MKILVAGILGEEELTLSDNGLEDAKLLNINLNGQEITVDLIELYRSVIPFLAKLTPPQVGTDKV